VEKKRTLKIDLDELCSAIEDSSYEHEYYLDPERGRHCTVAPSSTKHAKVPERIREMLDAAHAGEQEDL
jgi:hypothetical protein